MITRYPGQSFSRSEVLARQIESHLMTPDRVYGGYLISNLRIAESLMQRAELDPTLIMGVYARIVGSPEWEKVLERMKFLQEPERAVFWNKRFRAVGVANPRGLNVIVD
ncbi:MAG: hypothetical protein IPG04_33690 [Polyangiaceae bacterium]|nr:hypothetical protein [Polyangiaceae bacterium]